jgi:hypothetical protein
MDGLQSLGATEFGNDLWHHSRETLLAETHVAGLSPIWTLAPMIVPNPAF